MLAIGYSMGARSALPFAEAHPLKVRGLCLLAPGGLEYTPDRFTRFVRDTPVLGNWAMHVLGPHILRKGANGLRSRALECSDIAAAMAQETRRKGYFPGHIQPAEHAGRRSNADSCQACKEGAATLPQSGAGKTMSSHSCGPRTFSPRQTPRRSRSCLNGQTMACPSPMLKG